MQDTFDTSSLPSGSEGLATAAVTLLSNGKSVAASTGANVLGNPLTALTWLANRLNQDGYLLEEGQIVMTGAAAAVKVIEPGELIAKFDDLGSIGSTSLVKLNIIL